MLRKVNFRQNSRPLMPKWRRSSARNCLQRNCTFEWEISSGYSTSVNMKYHTKFISSLYGEEKSRSRKSSILLLSYHYRQRLSLASVAKAINQHREINNSRSNSENKANNKEKPINQHIKGNTNDTGVLAKFKGIVNTFWVGCKQLLWIDARKAWATRKKLKRHDYDLTILTREELRHMRQVHKISEIS